MNESYSMVYFGCFENSFVFDKVICLQQGFIDWADNISYEKFLCVHFSKGIEFICRSWRDEIEESKNLSNRHVSFFS